MPSKQKIQHVDGGLKFLSVFSKTEDFDKIVEIKKSGKVSDMCEVIERIKAEEQVKGRTQERIERTIQILNNLKLSMNLNLQQAMDAIRLDEEEQKMYRELMEKI